MDVNRSSSAPRHFENHHNFPIPGIQRNCGLIYYLQNIKQAAHCRSLIGSIFMKNISAKSVKKLAGRILLSRKTYGIIAIFAAAYALGAGAGYLADRFSQDRTAGFSSDLSLSGLSEAVPASAEGSWGLSFQEEGQPPAANATFEELAKYDAWYAQDTDEKILYLTFDSGYENGNTPAILDALKKHNVSATFFVVGTYIESEPDLVRRMVDEGHTVGNHTWHHPDMSQIASLDSFQKELMDVEDAFQEATGQEMTRFYRPPQGRYSESNLQMAKELGYKTFFWSLAYVDWLDDDQPTKEEAFEKLLGRIHPGAIVLLHSTSDTNAAILDELLTKWEEMGYQIRPLAELVKAGS